MSTPFDPYKAPQANLDAAPSDPDAPVPGAVVQLLAQTRPWVKLTSVLVFVGMGLVVLAFVFIMTALGRAGRSDITRVATFVPFGIVLVLYIPPAVFLWQYAANIRRLQGGGGMRALEDALGSQKSFWKYVGVLAIMALVLYAIGFLGTGLFGTLLRHRE